MANDANRAVILSDLIQQAGVPISGVSVQDITATPVAVTVAYQPSATAEQIALGEQIKDAFDWRRRRALARATVVAAFNSLTAGQRAAIQLHDLAEKLRNDPRLAAAIGQAIGVPVVVDEVDPT